VNKEEEGRTEATHDRRTRMRGGEGGTDRRHERRSRTRRKS